MVNHVARVSEEKNKEKYLYSFLQEEETNTHILPEIHDPEFGTILRNFPSTPSTHSRKEEGHICPQSGLFKDGPHRGNPPSAGGQVSTHTDEVGGGGGARSGFQTAPRSPARHPRASRRRLVSQRTSEAPQTAVMSDFTCAPYLAMRHMTTVNV